MIEVYVRILVYLLQLSYVDSYLSKSQNEMDNNLYELMIYVSTEYYTRSQVGGISQTCSHPQVFPNSETQVPKGLLGS